MSPVTFHLSPVTNANRHGPSPFKAQINREKEEENHKNTKKCLLFSNISDTFFYQKFPALSVQFINGGGGDNIYFHTDIATT